MELIKSIKESAKKLNKTIVLPESTEQRTLMAANQILKEHLAKIILIGKKSTIMAEAEKLNLEFIEKAEIIDPLNNPKKEEYAKIMVDMRHKKGMTKDNALQLLENPLYLATLMVKAGDADGEVAGAENATGDVLLPAFHYVKTKKGISVVSGAFIMILPKKEFGEDGVLFFADCAVFPNPNAKQLAEIAVATGRTAQAIAGFKPKIAMLSYSTKGSAEGEIVDKVSLATTHAKAMAPDLDIDGEMQADTALIESIKDRKAPNSTVGGKANILVFPDLQSGNISYKLVQRLAGAEAIGPILQGMAAPINDLSRGCSVSDIVNLVAITANQASEQTE